ncbi:lipid A biosynthesis lauroyl acyltransferase [Simiduia litorea]|uniref:lysophospholipid acyltransferase family protein n=1 Tax=Simiduia litorea TaxID=1435348 RepID=UPI0036F31634
MVKSNRQKNTSDLHLQNTVFRWSFVSPKYWLLWLWFALLWLVTRLPYAWMRWLARSFGLSLFYVVRSRRRVALRNLELCFPDWSEARRLAVVREHFAGAGLTLFESGLVWWSDKDKLARLFNVDDSSLALIKKLEGKPVLFFGLHNTCVEIVYAYLSLLRPYHVLFRVNNNAFWEYMATRSRSRFDVRLVPRKQVGEFLDNLRRGNAGLLAADQDLGRKRSVFVPFFGVTAATVTSLHDFSAQTGAQVVFAEAFRNESGYELKLHELEGFPSDDAWSDTLRMNQMIESSVVRHPDQYLWLHKRFKTRPDGEKSLY